MNPSEESSAATRRLLILQAMFALGKVIELDFDINEARFVEEISAFKDSWKQYNPRKPIARKGLSITSLDGGLSGEPNLDSLREYNLIHGTRYDEADFTRTTPVFSKMECLQPVLSKFGPHLGRSHFIRFDRGGHVPPHRDAFGFGMTCFRILALCQNCRSNQFVFMLDGERVHLEQGKVYLLETRLIHSVFSFSDDATIMVLNVKVSEASFRLAMESVR